MLCTRRGMAVSLQWLQRIRAHGQVLSALLGEPQGGTWCTPENCVRNFLQTDEGTSDRSHQALEAYIRQQMTRGTVEISGCLFGVSFELVRIFQQEVEGKGG